MIIFYSCAVVMAVLAVILRRDLARLSTLHLRHTWLIWVALLIQVVVISLIPGHGHTTIAVIHLGTYATAAAFAFANRKIRGAAPIFAGGAANLLAIAVNGGTMPAARRALIASGWHPRPGHFANSAVVPHAHLAFLGDILATPAWLPGHDVFSIGDVLIVIGFATVVWRACAGARPPLPGAPRSATVVAEEADHADSGDAGNGDGPRVSRGRAAGKRPACAALRPGP